VFFPQNPADPTPEPLKEPTPSFQQDGQPGELPPAWEDIRTCVVAFKLAGATPEEIADRLADFALDPEVIVRLLDALFAAPPKKKSRHKRPPAAPTPQEEAQRLERAYRDGLRAVGRSPGRPCDGCGLPIPPGQAQQRIKNEAENVGAVGYSRTVQVLLCPGCADKFDGNSAYFTQVFFWAAGILLGLLFLGCVFTRR
jgi:hypothetical protein